MSEVTDIIIEVLSPVDYSVELDENVSNIDFTEGDTVEMEIVVESGIPGPVGFTGSRGHGYTGSRGADGVSGVNGFTGSRGVAGVNGFTGSRGLPGEYAAVGFTGSAGVGLPGYTGSRGAGYAGSRGPIGFTGSRGLEGIGYTGSKGDPGDAGGVGFTGSKGDAGALGYTGSRGEPGEGGSIGFTGSRGTAGTNGFVGSKGDAGSLGYTGSRGPIGYTGSRGPIGYTGSGGGGGGSLTNVQTILTEDKTITSTYNNAWVDVVSIELTAGTWLINAHMLCRGDANGSASIGILDNTTVLASGFIRNRTGDNIANFSHSVALTRIYTVASTKTIKLRFMKHDGGGDAYVYYQTPASEPYNHPRATLINAVKIA